jgi:hypothetical protein
VVSADRVENLNPNSPRPVTIHTSNWLKITA